MNLENIFLNFSIFIITFFLLIISERISLFCIFTGFSLAYFSYLLYSDNFINDILFNFDLVISLLLIAYGVIKAYKGESKNERR